MKKLILLSLSMVAFVGMAAHVTGVNTGGNEKRVGLRHVRVVKSRVADPFEGIGLSEIQKARLHEVFGAVRMAPADSGSAQKLMTQIKKVLTLEQYMHYLENVASGVASRMILAGR